MEPHQFDVLTRSAARLSTRRTLLSLAIGGAFAWLRRGEVPAKNGHGKGGKGKTSKRTRTVTICHLGQTIRVKKDKALNHLRHGDTLRRMPRAPPTTTSSSICTRVFRRDQSLHRQRGLLQPAL